MFYVSGKIEILAGSMFSGKTQRLILEINLAQIAERNVLVFKPETDNRWGGIAELRSRTGSRLDAIPVTCTDDLIDKLEQLLKRDTYMVAIDEAQFLGGEIAKVAMDIARIGITVIMAGLPLDFRAENFGPMPKLLAAADKISRLTAVCTHRENGGVCGLEATRTQRLIDGEPAHYSEPIIAVGDTEMYAARCVKHHIVPGKPESKFMSMMRTKKASLK